jgi:hypothetical protein
MMRGLTRFCLFSLVIATHTALAAALETHRYVADGQTCRAFLADIEAKAPARRLQGRGCRIGDGPWVVSDLKPFAS